MHVIYAEQFISCTPCMQLVIKGIRRSLVEVSRPRLPITPEVMRMFKKHLSRSPNSYDNLCFGQQPMSFFGFLHTSKFVVPDGVSYNPSIHLSMADISWDQVSHPKSVAIHIKASKTDPFI